MKAQATARAAQGYTRSTPLRCGTCAKRDGITCGMGGFPVALWGVCREWSGKKSKTSSPAE
jgi:hypothetical protein